MSIEVEPEAPDGAEPLWIAISRLGAGFRQMEALATELVTLDAVNADISQTQSTIRRDIANAVLQTAFVLKDTQEQTTDRTVAEKSDEAVEINPRAMTTDMWAKRLVRWADRFGRELFGQPRERMPTGKKSPAVLPRQES